MLKYDKLISLHGDHVEKHYTWHSDVIIQTHKMIQHILTLYSLSDHHQCLLNQVQNRSNTKSIMNWREGGIINIRFHWYLLFLQI